MLISSIAVSVLLAYFLYVSITYIGKVRDYDCGSQLLVEVVMADLVELMMIFLRHYK